ncbi:MAG: Gfo/Idh/MocA family protein, partial [Candidatus Binatia bacterium]
MVRVLVVGCGSIGKRHIRNLKKLRVAHIAAVDTREDRRTEVRDLGVTRLFPTLAEALREPVDAAVICTPTALHVGPALEFARRGVHLMIEKPISHNLDGVDELLKVCREKRLVCFIAYVMRFDPSLRTVKKLVDGGKVGRVLSVRSETSAYLPDWHPWEDYRTFYMAKTALGGGAILDESHSLDYARWLFGEPERVFCLNDRISDLEIDTDDINEMILRFKSGAVANIHHDLLGRLPRENLEIVGSEGTVLWDAKSHEVWHYRAPKKPPKKAQKKEWEVLRHKVDDAHTYVVEMRHFIECVRTGDDPLITGEDGKRTLQLILGGLESKRTERMIPVADSRP